MLLDYLIGYRLNGYKKKKGKIFFIPKCFNCGKKLYTNNYQAICVL